MSGTASAHLVGKMIAAAIVLGADESALMAAVALSAEQITDREARVPHATVQRVWGAAEQLTGEDAFGLRFAELALLQPDNALAYSVQASPTLADAFSRIARYVSLVHDSLELALVKNGADCRLRFVVNHPLGSVRHGIEAALGLAQLFCRRYCAGPFALREVSFRHARPRSTFVHQRVFGAPLRFAADHDELLFDSALLDVSMSRADGALAHHLDKHLDVLLKLHRSSPEVLQRVARTIGRELSGGVPKISAIAIALRMSPRTLQRALRQSGSSYQAAVDQVRRDLAIRYLSDGAIALSDVAFLVGFSELSAFHRAFKRWTGMTPGECRRRAVAHP